MKQALIIVGFLWDHPQGSVHYTPEHANTWARMLHRHLTIPHRFVLVTDQPGAAFDPLIEPMELWQDWRELKRPSWSRFGPYCYPRLKVFSEAMRELIGARFACVDLDCLPVNCLDPIFTREEEFLIIKRAPTTRKDLGRYQASMFMMNAGARKQVWNNFKGHESIVAAREFIGSDQSWLNFVLKAENTWDQSDGVYSFVDLYKARVFKGAPPANARIVFFNGGVKQWEFAGADDYRWIDQHYHGEGNGQQATGNKHESMREISPSEDGQVEDRRSMIEDRKIRMPSSILHTLSSTTREAG